MSNYMIGKNAVAAIEQATAMSKFLLSEISVGDTYPSWDGEILVYNSEEARNQRKKTDLFGRLPVQVKGHQINKFSIQERSEKIQVTDLINYSNDAGILYLVVEMLDVNDVTQTKIFYSELLKYDIEPIIKEKKQQQTINHTVKELPKERFYAICKHFLLHRKEQGFKYIPWDGELEYDEYLFTVVGNKESDLDYFLFESGTFVYGIKENSHIKDALGRFKIISKIEQDNINIGTKDKIYYTQIYREKTKEGQNIKFGKGFTISSLDKENIKFNFTEKGSLRERIEECEFFLALLKENAIHINCTKILLNLKEDTLKKTKETLPKYIQELKDILSIFNQLGVQPNEDFDTFKEDLKEINFLIKALIKKSINVNEFVKTNLQIINIGSYKFVLAKGVGKFEDTLFNLFDYEEIKEKFRVFVSIEEKFESTIEHTPYISIKPDLLFECDNLKLEAVQKALMTVDYTSGLALEATNQYLLRCLFYIDEKNKISKRKEILIMISEVYQQMYKITDNPIYFINHIQAIYRFRKLGSEEMTQLTIIKMEVKDNEVIKCAIDILLDNKSEFYYRLNELSQKEQDAILKFPIYNLIKEKNE